MQFGHWLHARLRAIGLSQEAASKDMGRERSFIHRLVSNQQQLRVDEVAPFAKTLQVSKLELLAACGLDLTDEIEAGTTAQASASLDIMRACIEEFFAAAKANGVRVDLAQPEQISRTVLYLYGRAVERSRADLQQLATDIVHYESAPGGTLPKGSP